LGRRRTSHGVPKKKEKKKTEEETLVEANGGQGFQRVTTGAKRGSEKGGESRETKLKQPHIATGCSGKEDNIGGKKTSKKKEGGPEGTKRE